MDIDQVKTVTISKDFDLDKYRAFNQSQGSRYSYMEGFVPEQFFSTDGAPAQAVSAVSAIAQASAEGQKILTITPENQGVTLPLLTIDQIAKDEIIAGLNSGMAITAHESPIAVGNWEGSGYIILDSEMGAGAYKISGGENGSFIGDVIVSTIITAFGFAIAPIFFAGGMAALGPVLLAVLAAVNFSFWVSSMKSSSNYQDFNVNNFTTILGTLGGLALLGLSISFAMIPLIVFYEGILLSLGAL
jgi:hypothetical protein